MSSLILLIAIGCCVYLLNLNLVEKYDEFPAFVNEYRQSNLYWISALVGAFFGSSDILSSYSTEILSIIFFVPILGYYLKYQPFGLKCSYSPVDEERGFVDTYLRKKRIAKMENGEAIIKLEVEAGHHLKEYSIGFEEPTDTRIRHAQYQSNKVQEYDDENDVLIVSGEGRDHFTVGIVVEDDGYDKVGSEPFRVRELSTGAILTEVDIE